MRAIDTLWVFASMALFMFAFMGATAWALRLDGGQEFDQPLEAIVLYTPWSNDAVKMEQLQQSGLTLVSSNTSDTAWLVKVPSAHALKTLLQGQAIAAFQPTDIAIVVAGCGAVARSDLVSPTHNPS